MTTVLSKFFFGCAHFQCNRKALKDFVHTVADTMDDDDFLIFTRTHQFHFAWLVVAGDCGIHRGERRCVAFHIIHTVLLNRLRFSQTYSTDSRMAEDNGRDIGVIQILIRFVVE